MLFRCCSDVLRSKIYQIYYSGKRGKVNNEKERAERGREKEAEELKEH